jgi:hypothetical protein
MYVLSFQLVLTSYRESFHLKRSSVRQIRIVSCGVAELPVDEYQLVGIANDTNSHDRAL